MGKKARLNNEGQYQRRRKILGPDQAVLSTWEKSPEFENGRGQKEWSEKNTANVFFTAPGKNEGRVLGPASDGVEKKQLEGDERREGEKK